MTNETMDLMERVLQDELERADKGGASDETRYKAIQNAYQIAEKLNEAEQAVIRWQEIEDRKEIEKAKLESAKEIEATKKRLSPTQIAMEVMKVGVPALVTVATLYIWRKSYCEMGHFEETGHYTSNMSREVRLPRILK